MTFSPGPWRVEQPDWGDSPKMRVYSAEAKLVVVLRPWADHPIEADARLIAAAPEMYAMIDNLAASLASVITSEFQTGGEEPGEKDEDVVAARALLARIDGKDPAP